MNELQEIILCAGMNVTPLTSRNTVESSENSQVCSIKRTGKKCNKIINCTHSMHLKVTDWIFKIMLVL